ncbi:Crp/Fnr family transcriptional regulator [Flavobacterium sp. AG291]|uniref:Crp/Fnr family transcriptional regulator n=1 Tax=Flavobacterium sp. AG291 TaxID=2184000 RepID=UPI000E0C6E74|nr:Crp/Fnr family transcriptional regulator [Flavobacterium sp. AG291]RDI05473.1 CRP-like cAMP-binding protein [Flavobacterium sp. AG291]
MQKLITYLNSLVRFTPESWELIKPVIIRRTFEKGELLSQPEATNDALYFVEQGYLRTFAIEESVEVNKGLYFEGELVAAIQGIAIEACESVTVLVLDKSTFFGDFELIPQLTVLWKNCLSFITSKIEAHNDFFTLYTPSERYEYIIKNKPELLERVQPHILASYLGVPNETLNRIKRRRLQLSM